MLGSGQAACVRAGSFKLPGTPTAVTAVTGNAQATVSFTPSVLFGGSPNSYRVVSTPGSISAVGPGSPIVVTGLSNGTSYTFKAQALNASGSGLLSAASSAVTPYTVPDAPTSVIATALGISGQIQLAWTPPANNGGSPITNYTAQYRVSPSGTWITPDWSGWTLSGGATVANGILTLPVDGAKAESPLLYIGASANWSFLAGYYATVAAGVNSANPDGSKAVRRLTTYYFDANGNPTKNSNDELINGNATNFALNEWTSGSALTWSYLAGANVRYVRVVVSYTSPWTDAYQVRTPRLLYNAGANLVVPGLTNGTAYDFRMAAVNEAGVGAYSSPVSTATPYV